MLQRQGYVLAVLVTFLWTWTTQRTRTSTSTSKGLLANAFVVNPNCFSHVHVGSTGLQKHPTKTTSASASYQSLWFRCQQRTQSFCPNGEIKTARFVSNDNDVENNSPKDEQKKTVKRPSARENAFRWALIRRDERQKNRHSHFVENSRFRQHLVSIMQTRPTKAAKLMDQELATMERLYFASVKHNYSSPAHLYNAANNTTSSLPPDNAKLTFRGPVLQPDASCYQLVAEAYLKTNTTFLLTRARSIQALLERCKYMAHVGYLAHSHKNPHRDENKYNQEMNAVPTEPLYACAVRAWLFASDPDAARNALNELQHAFQQNPQHRALALDRKLFTFYVQSLTHPKINLFFKKNNVTDHQVAQQALDLLRYLQYQSERRDCNINHFKMRPDTVLYSTVMNCISVKTQNITLLEQLFQEVKDLHDSAPSALEEKHLPIPSNSIYSVLMTAYHRSTLDGNVIVDRVQTLFDELQNRFQTTDSPWMKRYYFSDAYIYTALLSAYYRVTTLDYYNKVMERTEQMLATDFVRRPYLSNSGKVHGAILKLKAHPLNPNGWETAHETLKEYQGTPPPAVFVPAMEAYLTRQLEPEYVASTIDEIKYLSRRQGHGPVPDTLLWAAKRFIKENTVERVLAAEAIIHFSIDLIMMMQDPDRSLRYQFDIGTIRDVISQLRAIAPEVSGTKAQRLLNQAVRLYHFTKQERFAPKQEIIDEVFLSWALCHEPDATTKALNILQDIDDTHIADLSNQNLTVGNKQLSDAMRVIARTGNRTMMERFKQLYTTFCLNSISDKDSFHANEPGNTLFFRELEHNQHDDVGYMARDMLEIMDQVTTTQSLRHLRPSRFKYNFVLKFYLQRDQIQQALDLLSQMEEIDAQRQGSSDYVSPLDAVSYNVVIRHLLRQHNANNTTNDPIDNFESAERLLQRCLARFPKKRSEAMDSTDNINQERTRDFFSSILLDMAKQTPEKEYPKQSKYFEFAKRLMEEMEKREEEVTAIDLNAMHMLAIQHGTPQDLEEWPAPPADELDAKYEEERQKRQERNTRWRLRKRELKKQRYERMNNE